MSAPSSSNNNQINSTTTPPKGLRKRKHRSRFTHIKKHTTKGNILEANSDDDTVELDDDDEKRLIPSFATVPKVHQVLIPIRAECIIPAVDGIPLTDKKLYDTWPIDGDFPRNHLAFHHNYLEQHIPIINGYNVNTNISAVFSIQFVAGPTAEYRLPQQYLPRAAWLYPRDDTTTTVVQTWPYGHSTPNSICDIVVSSADSMIFKNLVPQLRQKNGVSSSSSTSNSGACDPWMVRVVGSDTKTLVQNAVELAKLNQQLCQENRALLFSWWIDGDNLNVTYIGLCIAIFYVAWMDCSQSSLVFLNRYDHQSLFTPLMDCFHYHQIVTAVASSGGSHYCISDKFPGDLKEYVEKILEVLPSLPESIRNWWKRSFLLPSCMCEWKGGCSTEDHTHFLRVFPEWLSKWLIFPGVLSREPFSIRSQRWQDRLTTTTTTTQLTLDYRKSPTPMSLLCHRLRMIAKAKKMNGEHPFGTAGELTLDFLNHVHRVWKDQFVPDLYRGIRCTKIWNNLDLIKAHRTVNEITRPFPNNFNYAAVVTEEWNWDSDEKVSESESENEVDSKENQRVVAAKVVTVPSSGYIPPTQAIAAYVSPHSNSPVPIVASIVPSLLPTTASQEQQQIGPLSMQSRTLSSSLLHFSPPLSQHLPDLFDPLGVIGDFGCWSSSIVNSTTDISMPISTDTSPCKSITTGISTPTSTDTSASTSVITTPDRVTKVSGIDGTPVTLENRCVKWVSEGNFASAINLLRAQATQLTSQKLRHLSDLLEPVLFDSVERIRKKQQDTRNRIKSNATRKLTFDGVIAFDVTFDVEMEGIQLRKSLGEQLEREATQFAKDLGILIREKSEMEVHGTHM